MIGLGLEMIGEMKDGSLNDQIEYETDFVEVLALETNRAMDNGQLPVVVGWDKEDVDCYTTWMVVLDASEASRLRKERGGVSDTQ